MNNDNNRTEMFNFFERFWKNSKVTILLYFTILLDKLM